MGVRNYTSLALVTLFLYGCSDRQQAGLEQRISQEAAQPNGKPDKYAVLINGADEKRFVAEITNTYTILLENGFPKENIYVLVQDRRNYSSPVDDVANKKNIETIFRHLRKKIDAEDKLVIHISDHGVRTKIKLENSNPEEYQEITEIALPSGNVSEIDLEKYLSGINPKVGIITTEICYGGGLVKRLGKGKYIGIAQTTEKEVGYSRLGDTFGGFFYEAFRNSVESDKNKDGRVTIDEAFNYAKSKHSWSRSGEVKPQLISELDVKNISLK